MVIRWDYADASKLLGQGQALVREFGWDLTGYDHLQQLPTIAWVDNNDWRHAYVPRVPRDGAILAALSARVAGAAYEEARAPGADPSGAAMPGRTRWSSDPLAATRPPSRTR